MAGTQGDVHVRKLVDALYDELHPNGPGGDEPDRSGLRDYHGRSKLTTWLRVLIAQRHVDSSARREVRDTEAARRTEKPAGPLISRDIPGRSGSLLPDSTLNAAVPRGAAPSFRRCDPALPASDRLFAALYYAEQLDRSQMAQLQGVPEITVSRRLADIRLALHTAISGILASTIASTIASTGAQKEDGVACDLTPAQIERCFTYAFEDWQSEIHARPAKPSLWEAKISVLRDLPLRRDKKSGGKESSKERDESAGCWPARSSAAPQILAPRARRPALTRSCFPHMRTAPWTRMRPRDGSCISPIACGAAPFWPRTWRPQSSPRLKGSRCIRARLRCMPTPPAQILLRSWSRLPRRAAGCRSTSEQVYAPGFTVCLALDRSSRHVGDRRGHRFCFAPLEPASYFALPAASRA